MRTILGYLDAGSGALLVQMIAGGVAGIAAYVKFRLARIRGRVDAIQTAEADTASPESP